MENVFYGNTQNIHGLSSKYTIESNVHEWFLKKYDTYFGLKAANLEMGYLWVDCIGHYYHSLDLPFNQLADPRLQTFLGTDQRTGQPKLSYQLSLD